MSNLAYTPEEVAEKLKISKYTVYELIKRGELNAFKVGNKMRVEEKDLEEFKQRGKTSTKTSVQKPHFETKGKEIKITGSHDFLLEHLIKYITKKKDIRIQPSYIGSLEGLMQLYRGHTDMAAVHLMNADTLEFNLPFIKQLFIQEPITVIRLAARKQGFIVKEGNPLGIMDFKDLSNKPITFINRQKGSGTRILIDHFLTENNIESSSIKGYENEGWNHLETASEIKAGRADVAFGIKSAADKLRLDFIPVISENFDIIFRWTSENKDMLKTIIEVIQSNHFQESLLTISGYDTSEIGKVIYEFGHLTGGLN